MKLVHKDVLDARDHIAGSKNDDMVTPSSNIPHNPSPVRDVKMAAIIKKLSKRCLKDSISVADLNSKGNNTRPTHPNIASS
jgi:hypothetical protein